jgi:hypothetical protein
MTNDEETDFAALDAYISAQLDKAADTHASHTDTHIQLEAIRREVSSKDNHDGTTAAGS